MSPRRLLAILATVLLAGAAVASTFRVWFTEDFFTEFVHQARGYDTVSGKSVLVLAGVGAVCALIGSWVVRTWLWIGSTVLGLAGFGAVVAAGATYKPHSSANTWSVTTWFWVSLGLTIGWSVAALATYPSLNRPAHRRIGWLQRDPNPFRTRLTVAFIAASASSVFLLIGAFGPWQTAGVASNSGLDNSQDGMVVLAAAFMASLSLVSYVGLGSRRALLIVLGLAIVAAATSVYDLHHVATETDVVSGWGINLDAEASVALVVSALILLIRPGRSLISPPPVASSGSGAASEDPEGVESTPGP
jgi:hypothetical protein